MAQAANEFLDALGKLLPEIRRRKLDMGIFLAQSINLHADEESLRRITEDIREWTEASKRDEVGGGRGR
jgi:hypothetical protein